jgi:hypothetical protein
LEIEAAEQVSVWRLRQREPRLSEDEAYRIVRQGLTRYWVRKKGGSMTPAQRLLDEFE